MPTPHPRLADHAVLLRRGSALQIGSTPDRALVIDDPPAGLFELLTLIDGHHSVDALADRAGRTAGLHWPRLLDELRRHRLLAEPEPTLPLRAQVLAAGAWGLQMADLLLRGGANHVAVALLDDDPRVQRRGQLLAAEHRGRLFLHQQWTIPREPDVLTIINTETAETDRALTSACAGNDITHLVVRPVAEGVVLGPLVVPGAGPCLNCLDLHARTLDPQWPQLLMQLTRVRLAMPDLAARWAAVTAATEVLGFHHGGNSALLGHTATVTAPQWTPRWRRWRSHPSCLCHWDGQDIAGLMIAA
ncbi:hypothetical protein [Enemella sp. A6]|uniref:hypothetical protein n=1 Tax=Enemella sp. A6 TaxID=3440152 RepID=UPI003EBCEA4B